MRGFNKPHKQKAVKYWVKAAKLSIGRLWVCWSEEVEVCQRRVLWEEMEFVSRFVAGSNNPWIIQGDFNVALHEEEHSRFMETRSDRAAIKDFHNVVLNCDMVDLAQVGPCFTWTNCQDDNPISKKRDRVMVNGCWLNAFPQSYTTFESGGVSDHQLMHTFLREAPQGNMKPFKFFDRTTSHPRFLEVVERVWNESAPIFHSRTALKCLQEKLKSLKFELRGLNRDMYGDLPGRVKQAYAVLCEKQNAAMSDPQTSTILQDIREEGEIDDDDAVQVVTDQLERRVEEKESGEIVSGKALAVNQKSSSQRQSGKGSKKLIVNSRDLVKVMSQQQKGQTNRRKASSRKH
ncbi:hypothetical protein F2Q68_00033831 [Brassica cretica]|uniref:Endonuclease/exonuclease/phosphatase domain-containing protein n=1 Tax=Brassica cretica TaxID=69181 RepID=A0A8S9H924_BRACR|nr:hypothetical protein F2Q68_00033831 [Brassica cretica]